jgi:glycosyltransferase involved in cell wall biosynthesis
VEEPLVSILMPVHNDEDYVDESIQSTMNQQYSNWEYRIIDDGSTDGSFKKLKQWSNKDERIHCKFADHQGIVPSLNAAAKEARGQYIARMDADDLMHPQRLAKQIAFLKENTQIGLIGTCFRHFTESISEVIPRWVRHHECWSNQLLSTKEIHDALFAESPIAHPTFCMRKVVFEKLGGYQDSLWAEDYDFLHRARINGILFGKVESILVEKRFNTECISTSQPRYQQAANMVAKVHFGKLKGIFDQRALWVVGSGGSAKSLLKALQKLEVPVEGVIDNKIHQGTPRKIFGCPIIGVSSPEKQNNWVKFKDKLLLLAVGGEKGQQLVNQFKIWGWNQPENFLKLV